MPTLTFLLSRVHGIEEDEPQTCSHRYLFAALPQIDAAMSLSSNKLDESNALRAHVERLTLLLSLAQQLNRTAIVTGVGDMHVDRILEATHRRSFCMLTLEEAQDLHWRFAIWYFNFSKSK